eukprot:TRINITY_DN34071_c1_g3_i1.p1 TRINITY_DN34071_c1_g3~~TRINITY_DN34071_c1_g3_i1.p1  ORF type:complete len:340 (+),score=70.36 TRINITY_DN34071_c1_g3_i1:56-1021(+)
MLQADERSAQIVAERGLLHNHIADSADDNGVVGGASFEGRNEMPIQTLATLTPYTLSDWSPNDHVSNVCQERRSFDVRDDGSMHTEGEAQGGVANVLETLFEDDGDDVLQNSKPRPKLGKISFNMRGANVGVAAAQTQVNMREDVAAARANRLTFRHASTQTERDPENQGGDIVTIWPLHPRGMETLPRFPRRRTKRQAREATGEYVEASRSNRPRRGNTLEGVVVATVPKRAETIEVEQMSLATGASVPVNANPNCAIACGEIVRSGSVVEHKGDAAVVVAKAGASAQSAVEADDGKEEMERRALVEALCGLDLDDEDGV